MARYMRTDLGRGHSKLAPPAVVGAGIAWHGPGVYLRTPSSPNQYNRRRTHWLLRPPTVLAVPEAFSGPNDSSHPAQTHGAVPQCSQATGSSSWSAGQPRSPHQARVRAEQAG